MDAPTPSVTAYVTASMRSFLRWKKRETGRHSVEGETETDGRRNSDFVGQFSLNVKFIVKFGGANHVLDREESAGALRSS